MARKQRIELIKKIEAHRGSRVLCCITSDRQNAAGVIAKDFIPIFFNHLSSFKEYTKVDVLMFTQGGDTLAAFGLSRLLREFKEAGEVATLVPEKCHSAGTLFALGSNKIFMGKAATLTPIDPSISGPLNPVIEPVPGQRQPLPISVESVAGYRTLIREDWRLDDEATGMAFRILAEKINPLALGDVYRSRQQIERLARTLLKHRKDDEKIRTIVETFTRGLGSHDYPISRTEAREFLGAQIGDDDAVLEGLMWDLFQDFSQEMQLGQIFDPGMVVHAAVASGSRQMPVSEVQKIVMVESEGRVDYFERELRLSAVQTMTPAGPAQAVQGAVVRAGWRNEA